MPTFVGLKPNEREKHAASTDTHCDKMMYEKAIYCILNVTGDG